MVKELKNNILTSIEISEEVRESLTKILDVVAKIMNVPVALIMKAHEKDIEVFEKSGNAENPYERGETANLGIGLYSETVMDSKRELLIPNVLKDPKWDHNPDMELGMISYLGLPLLWPNGQIFGTICILDNKENSYSDIYRELLTKFRNVVQMHLVIMYNQELLQQEVSERKQIEKKLLKSEEKFRDLYENAPNSYFSVGTDSIIRSCNRRAKELLGYTKKKLIGRSVFELYADTPEGKAKAEEVFKKFMAGEAVNDVEIQMKRSDNTLIWVSLSVNIILDKDGEIVESRSMVVDITDRKHVEEDRDRVIVELKKALSEVKKLSGLLPICSNCKKIRDDEGYWKRIEQFISEHSEAEFTHGLCPDCAAKLYPRRSKDKR